MSSLRVRDAIVSAVQRVRLEDRPSGFVGQGGLFAVFDGEEPDPALAGLVTMHDVARFPQRIFADLLSKERDTRIHEDEPLEAAVRRLGEGGFEALAVVRADGSFLGAVTRESILGTLLESERRAQQTLRAREEQLRAILNAIPDFLIYWDAMGTYLDVFPSSNEALGSTSGPVIGRRVEEVLAPDVAGTIMRAIGAAVSTGQLQRFNLNIARPWGTYEYEARMIRSRADAVVCLLRDATEMSHLRAQLVFADRMVAMGTLAAGVAHEINNPLTYVLGNAVFIKRLLARPETIEGHLGEAVTMLDGILEGANHIRTIVQDLRSLARPDQGARAFVDVQRSLTSAMNLVMPQIRPRARLCTSFEPAPLIMASEARLGQVFLNLLMNAAQAIPEGASEQNSIRVSLRNEGRSIRITIADTGSGLTPDLRDRIFEAFFTTKSAEQGTGLGLFISNNIVTSMGGTITVEELPEGGCAFHVVLPVDQDPACAPANAPEVPRRRDRAGERARILLVDDDPMVLDVLARMLAPHEVVQVVEGGDALSRLLAEPDFDVVLCDMMMPGVSGMDVFKEAVARWPGLRDRFVFLTGAVYSDAARAFVRSIRNLVLEKPVDEDALLAAVAGVVARAGRATAGA